MDVDLYWKIASSVLANIASCFTAAGLEPPGDVYVARQGSAADDRSDCVASLVAIWQETAPGNDATWVQARGGGYRIGACVTQVTTYFTVRYSACWAATIKDVGGRPALPSPLEVDAASRQSLAAHLVLSTSLYGGEAFAGLPDLGLAEDEVRVGKIVPYSGAGVAGWKAQVGVTTDIGA